MQPWLNPPMIIWSAVKLLFFFTSSISLFNLFSATSDLAKTCSGVWSIRSNHWKPVGLAAHFSGASGQIKIVSGKWARQ